MKKQVTRYGSTLVFTFHVADQKMYGVEEGQVYELKMTLLDSKKLKKRKLKD